MTARGPASGKKKNLRRCEQQPAAGGILQPTPTPAKNPRLRAWVWPTRDYPYSRPVIFDEVQLTVEFQQKNAHVATRFNNLLHERLLCKEIRLIFEYALETARFRFEFTFLAFSAKTWEDNSSFRKNGFDPFWLVGIIAWMV
jgi:hypothetical protein